MSDKFNIIVMLDWGTENIRWSLGGEIFSMRNEFAPPSGILFNDPERMDGQRREVLSRCTQLVPWFKRLIRPKILAAVPLGSSGIETIGFVQMLKKEAQSVLLCEAPMVAAMGCGYSEDSEKPFGILEIGAGFSQFAVIRQCGIRMNTVIRRGGRDLDMALKRYLKRQLHFEPSYAELATVKRDWDRHETLRLGSVSVERVTMRKIYENALTPLAETLQDTLDTLTPEMTASLKSDGIMMTGGLASMPRLADFLTEQTSFPFRPAKNPEQAVMRGLLIMQKSMPSNLWN